MIGTEVLLFYIVVGECAIEDKFWSYKEVVVRTEVPLSKFHVLNSKGRPEKVQELIFRQVESMLE